jgi:hypothetical protein
MILSSAIINKILDQKEKDAKPSIEIVESNPGLWILTREKFNVLHEKNRTHLQGRRSRRAETPASVT